MLDASAILIGDGGGIVNSFPEPMVGGLRIAQLLYAPSLRHHDELRIEPAWLNGCLGVLRHIDGQLESAQSYDFDDDGRIVHVYVQRNPEKLRCIVARQASVLI